MAGHRSQNANQKLMLIILVLLIFWTGIFTVCCIRERNLLPQVEKCCVEYLVRCGVKGPDVVGYSQKEDDGNAVFQSLFQKYALLSYMESNAGSLETRQESDIVQLAMLFPGNYAKSDLWSAAAGDRIQERERFQNSDALWADISEQDNQEQNEIEEKAADENAKAAQKSEEAMVQAGNIALFDDGSTNITAEIGGEKEDKDKKTDSQGQTKYDVASDSKGALSENIARIQKLSSSKSRSYLLKNFYILDSSTSIDNAVFDVNKLLTMDTSITKKKKPQILIFHTHAASESFADSKAGDKSESIVGVGSLLAQILSEKYGYQVIHDETEYDKINGSIDRNKAYNNAYSGVAGLLKKYPTIQVVIDLHRDGVGASVHRTTVVDGKKTAQVMFFNGLSRNSSGNIEYLYNKNQQANLAFSLQMKIKCMQNFKDFAKPVYLKGYRYNMHLRQRYLLIELGNENNTLQEAKNAMPPLAKVLSQVLSGK